MKIGIITALAAETLPIYEKLGNITNSSVIAGIQIRVIEIGKDTLYLACAGAGEIRAAQATQMLVDIFDVETILNFGFVGAINPSLSIGDVVLVEKVVHSAIDFRFIDGTKIGQYDNRDDLYFRMDGNLLNYVRNVLPITIRRVTLSSEDAFVVEKEKKQQLRKMFGADICDMEAAGIALVCERNNIPMFSMKVVSDNADENANQDFSVTLANGLTKYEQYIPLIIEAVDGFGIRKELPPTIKQ